MTALLTLLLGVVVIGVIIAANGFFVAQEFAYMSVDRSVLGAKADAGDDKARHALAVTKRTSFMLSGAQLGITVTGLLVGYVAEPLVGSALGTLLGGVGVPAAVSIGVGTVLALAVSTVVQMIFGELFPKNLAIANPTPLARTLARPTRIYLVAFGWLITVFDRAAAGLLRLLKIEPVEDLDDSATAADLERIVADSKESGDLSAELSVVLDRILDFPQRDVEHAMVSRSRVDVVRPTTTVDEVRSLMATAHTRYPVVDDREQPVGVVHLVDVLGAQCPGQSPVTEIMRAPVVLPTLMSLPDALTQLSRSHDQLACVIDEYGGFTGVLTTEDLAEEVVGEIHDEHDEGGRDPEEVTAEGDGVWLVGGEAHVDEAERALEHELPRGDFETVAGLVISSHGALPAVGDVVVVTLPQDPGDLLEDEPVRRLVNAEVLEVERHVPSLLRLCVVEERGEVLAEHEAAEHREQEEARARQREEVEEAEQRDAARRERRMTADSAASAEGER
ncbi:hemolysin family protein [Pseudokineococcus sp. 1T1Z-3]|uniref:hemolysin family protein n=1 Tax=Pseudokineococcus sp. 1T1Z-3 TaxID=3132745 RepID=UPI00403F385B